jgi:nicotinic acid mononucleotide adenylyltransferase
MKLIELFETKQQKTIVMNFGRFNPPTIGHKLNIEYAMKYAEVNDYDYALVPTKTHDAKKNPLTFDQKVELFEKTIKGVKIIKDRELKTITEVIDYFKEKGYTKIVLIVGKDQAPTFKNLFTDLQKNDKSVKLSVMSSGDRTNGISGTQLRSYVKKNQLEKFKEIFIDPDNAEKWFKVIEKQLSVKV